MKILVGVLLILAAIVLAIYVGVWIMFVGGIVAIVHGASANPVAAGHIAWGCVRVLFAGLAAWLSFAVLAVPGVALINDA